MCGTGGWVDKQDGVDDVLDLGEAQVLQLAVQQRVVGNDLSSMLLWYDDDDEWLS